jgi:hypothetical protein
MTPRKRLLALAFLAGVVAVSSAVAARGDTGATKTGRTIHLLEDEAPSTAVPIGQHTGLRAGDESVSARSLFTTQKKPAGQLHISCIATTGGQNWVLLCTGVYALSGGTLVGTTLAVPSQGPNTLHIAITGGTGRYEGARGSVVSAGSKTGFANDTIHLLP